MGSARGTGVMTPVRIPAMLWGLCLSYSISVYSPVTEYPLLVAERRISLAILVSNVSRNFHFFVMFQQHFRSQQYGIGIVIYLARRRRKFLGLNESRSNLVMKFYVPNSKQCQNIYPARRRRKFEV